jgi:hypothetical protein
METPNTRSLTPRLKALGVDERVYRTFNADAPAFRDHE